MIAVLATALLLAADPQPAKPPPAPADQSTPAPAPPELSPEDAAVVEHLELLQKLELLQDLEVVDTGNGEDGKDAAGQKK